MMVGFYKVPFGSKIYSRNLFFIFFMLYFADFWSFTLYDGLPRSVVAPLSYLCIFYVFRRCNYLKKHYFGNVQKFVLLSFFLSCIPSIFVFGQSLYASVAGLTMYIFPVTLYFLLCKWNIEEKFVFYSLVIFTFIFALIEICQQFTYPTYLFAGRQEGLYTGTLEQRMGFWRFYIFGISYCLLSMTLSFGNILNKVNVRSNMIFFVISIISIYFFLSRKDIYVSFFSLIVGILFSRASGRFWVKFLFCFFVVFVYFFLTESMSELNQQTVYETTSESEDFIRLIAADYFINQMSDSPLYYMFGSGIPGEENEFQKLISGLNEYDKIFQDDCGFVGYFSKFGLIGVFAQLLCICKIIQNYRYINIGLLLFGFIQILICFFDFWGNNSRNLAAWSIYLYLIDKNIEKNKF